MTDSVLVDFRPGELSHWWTTVEPAPGTFMDPSGLRFPPGSARRPGEYQQSAGHPAHTMEFGLGTDP